MTIKYLNDPPTEDGFYLVREGGQLNFAYAAVSEHHDIMWEQLGIDFDVWTHADHVYEIEVIRKLDLEALANESESKVHE